MRILITGGAGFIGSNFVRYISEKYPSDEIVVLDKLTYAGNMNNLKDVMDKITFVKGDICNFETVDKISKGCDAVINFAAETHVDRSIFGSADFIRTDILGTHMLLEAARKHNVSRFVQISTDEVYGSAGDKSFTEKDVLRPSSPYSASKSSADLLTLSYFATYGAPVLITRSSNNFGEYQHPEKLIPKFIINAMNDIQLPLYGDGANIRDWIYVMDNCSGIDTVLRKGKIGEIYNIGGDNERNNLEITRMILSELGKSDSLIKFVNDRPGHDKRYSISSAKLKSLGWSPTEDLMRNLKRTISWYKENSWWWEPIISKQKIDFHGEFNAKK